MDGYNNYLGYNSGGYTYGQPPPQFNLGYGQTQTDNSVPNPFDATNFASQPLGNTNAGSSQGGGGSSPLSVVYAGNLVGLGEGAYQLLKSQSQLNALNKIPYPNYTVSPELREAYGSAQAMSNQGYTAGEKQAYQGNINQSNALSYQNALRSGGGNLSNDISAGINSGNVQAQNNFALGDAQLHRENMKYAGQLAGQIQGQNNLQTQNLIQQRQYQEQLLQQQGTAGMQSILNSATVGIGNFGSQGGGYSGLLKAAGTAALL